MPLRPLTPSELQTIETIKDATNAVLKASRKMLTEKIVDARKKTSPFHANLKQLEKQRDSIELITGQPVILQVYNERLFMDYEFIRKMCRGLINKDWKLSFRIWPIYNCLIIAYQSQITLSGTTRPRDIGSMELNALPLKQHMFLQDVPVIQIEE